VGPVDVSPYLLVSPALSNLAGVLRESLGCVCVASVIVSGLSVSMATPHPPLAQSAAAPMIAAGFGRVLGSRVGCR